MPEQHLIDKINGWLVAGIAGVLNVLLLTWRVHGKKQQDNLTVRVDHLEENKANASDCSDLGKFNEKQHVALFSKIDDMRTEIGGVRKEIGESRREVKADLNTITRLLRNGNK